MAWNDRKRLSIVNLYKLRKIWSKICPFRIRFAFNGMEKAIDLNRDVFEQICSPQFQLLEEMVEAIDLQSHRLNRVFAGSSSRLHWFQNRIGGMGDNIFLIF